MAIVGPMWETSQAMFALAIASPQSSWWTGICVQRNQQSTAALERRAPATTRHATSKLLQTCEADKMRRNSSWRGGSSATSWEMRIAALFLHQLARRVFRHQLATVQE